MKKVWIINQYNMPPEYGHLNRHYNFAKYLKKFGYDPIVFVGSHLHNTKKQMIEDNDKSIIKRYKKSEFQYFFVKTCNYSNNKIKRVYAMFEFCYNIIKFSNKIDKPDVIIGSSAHPLAALLAIYLAKKYKCQSIVEVRDLWPESFAAYNIIKKNNPVLKLLYKGEKWIYNNADKIIFTMEGGKDYIIEKGWDRGTGGMINLNKIYHINNGVDLEVYKTNRKKYAFKDEDLDNNKSFKVIYAGSIRHVNNVKRIVEAAQVIKNKHIENIEFLIFGDGDEREYLERYCLENKILNVKFKGFIEKKNIPYALSKSNLNIVHFEQNSLKKYGASLNKMFEYFASGKPTISDCEFGYDLIKRYNCGLVVDNANSEELANSIIKFYKMPKKEYNTFCENAIKAAHDYDFKILTQKLETLL